MFDQQELNQLYRYCLSLTGQRDSAFDLLQTALEKYLRQNRIQPRHKLAYIRTIIRYQFIDDYRQQPLLTPLEVDALDPVDFDIRTLEQIVTDERMLETIWQLLTASERELMYLWAAEGMTAREIAEELQQPRGTVLSKIHRIRGKINAALQDTKTVGERQ